MDLGPPPDSRPAPGRPGAAVAPRLAVTKAAWDLRETAIVASVFALASALLYGDLALATSTTGPGGETLSAVLVAAFPALVMAPVGFLVIRVSMRATEERLTHSASTPGVVVGVGIYGVPGRPGQRLAPLLRFCDAGGVEHEVAAAHGQAPGAGAAVVVRYDRRDPSWAIVDGSVLRMRWVVTVLVVATVAFPIGAGLFANWMIRL